MPQVCFLFIGLSCLNTDSIIDGLGIKMRVTILTSYMTQYAKIYFD